MRRDWGLFDCFCDNGERPAASVTFIQSGLKRGSCSPAVATKCESSHCMAMAGTCCRCLGSRCLEKGPSTFERLAGLRASPPKRRVLRELAAVRRTEVANWTAVEMEASDWQWCAPPSVDRYFLPQPLESSPPSHSTSRSTTLHHGKGTTSPPWTPWTAHP